ncbi:MAG TPA: hypothetical protein VFO62_04735, partial [Candidatus Binatia bacterium]|nr:hypothetical protein [Candidatus Binatia bacterium]
NAACNSLPSVSEVTDQGTQPEPAVIPGNPPSASPAIPAPQLMRFRFKGAFGRTDGVHFVRGPMRLAADGTCVGPGVKALEESPIIRSVGRTSDLAVFVIFDPKPGHPVPVWAYSAAAQPASTMPFSLASLRDSLQHALGGSPAGARLLPTQWDAGADPIPLASGVTGLRVALPPLSPGAAVPELADLSLASSAVRIVATHVGRRGPDDIAVELSSLIRHDCASLCEQFAAAGGVVCIDTLYSRVRDAAAVVQYIEDPFLCTVEIPKDDEGNEIRFNDFQEECEIPPPDPRTLVITRPTPGSKATIPVQVSAADNTAESGDGAASAGAMAGSVPASSSAAGAAATSATALFSGPAQCNDAPTSLHFWRSTCGAIHIPLDYSTIRLKQLEDGSSVPINRFLAGRSGVGRERDLDKRRIFVPGREFVGSTPPHDPGDVNPDTRWRFPEIDVWYPAGDGAAELGLRGVADKDESIVHIFPRRPAFRVCTDALGAERACMGVTDGGLFCATDTPTVPELQCEDTDDIGKYFACVGGGRDNMPCTRDAHCKRKDSTEEGDGICARQPICRPKGTVWRYDPDENPYPATATRCSTDAVCKTHEQCGYSLFDFGERVDAKGLYTLDASITDTSIANRKRRGACTNDATDACTNGGPFDPPKCAATARCRGFSLIAGEETD